MEVEACRLEAAYLSWPAGNACNLCNLHRQMTCTHARLCWMQVTPETAVCNPSWHCTMTALRDIAVRFYKLCVKLYTIRLILLSVDLPLLLQNCEADTLALWQGDEWLLTLSDDKHILQPAVHSADLDFALTPT